MAASSWYSYNGWDCFLPSVPFDFENYSDADCSKPIPSSSPPLYNFSLPIPAQLDTSLAHRVQGSSSLFAQLDTTQRNRISASGYSNRDAASVTPSSSIVHAGCSEIGDDADKMSCVFGLTRSQIPAPKKKDLGGISDLEIDETRVCNHNQYFTERFWEPDLAEKRMLERLQPTPGLAEQYSRFLGKESIERSKKVTHTPRETSLLDIKDSSTSLLDGTALGFLGIDHFLNAQNVSYEPLGNLGWNKGAAPLFENQQKQEFIGTSPSFMKMANVRQDPSYASCCNAPVTDVHNNQSTYESLFKHSTESGSDKLGRWEMGSTSDTYFNFELETGSKVPVSDGEKDELDDVLAAEKVEALTGCQVETNACKVLISSIHNLSKVLLGRLSNNNIEEFDALGLQTSICVLSQCLLKQPGSVSQMNGVALESANAGMKSTCSSGKRLERHEGNEQALIGTETQGMHVPHNLCPQAALEKIQDPLEHAGNSHSGAAESPHDEHVTGNSYVQEAGQQSDSKKIKRDAMTNGEYLEESLRNLAQLQVMILKMQKEICSERTESKAAVLMYKNFGIEAREALASCRSQFKEAKQEVENLQQMLNEHMPHSGTPIQLGAFHTHDKTVDSDQLGICNWTKCLPVSLLVQEKEEVTEGVSCLVENGGEHEPASKLTEIEKGSSSQLTVTTNLGKSSTRSLLDQLGDGEMWSGHYDPTMHVEKNKHFVEISRHLPDIKEVMSNSTPFQASTNGTSFEGSKDTQECSFEVVSQKDSGLDSQIDCDVKCFKSWVPMRVNELTDLESNHVDKIQKENIVRTIPVNMEIMVGSLIQSVGSSELGLASVEACGISSALVEEQCMQKIDAVKGRSNSDFYCSVLTKTAVRENYFDGSGAMIDDDLNLIEQSDWKAVPVWLEVGSGNMSSSDEQAEIQEPITGELDWEHVLEFNA